MPIRADKSAVCAINDSVGKICTDKLTSAGTRQNPAFAAREAAYSSSACEEQGHETRGRSKDCCSFPLHMQVLLIMLGPSFAERRCTDMLTKFTNRVIYRAHRRFIGLGSASTGHWPINRRCANKLCAYRVLPILVGKNHNRPPTMAGVFGSFLWRENICIPADYSATCSPLYVVLCSGWVLPVAQVPSYLQCLPPVRAQPRLQVPRQRVLLPPPGSRQRPSLVALRRCPCRQRRPVALRL